MSTLLDKNPQNFFFSLVGKFYFAKILSIVSKTTAQETIKTFKNFFFRDTLSTTSRYNLHYRSQIKETTRSVDQFIYEIPTSNGQSPVGIRIVGYIVKLNAPASATPIAVVSPPRVLAMMPAIASALARRCLESSAVSLVSSLRTAASRERLTFLKTRPELL